MGPIVSSCRARHHLVLSVPAKNTQLASELFFSSPDPFSLCGSEMATD